MKKEMEIKKDQPLAVLNVPAEELAASYGDFGADHVSIPRMVSLEGLSPEVREKLGAPGDLFIKTLNRNLGDKPVEVIVLMRMGQQLRWKPLGDGGGILCQANDGKMGTGDPGGSCQTCANRQWANGNPPVCDQVESFIVVLREDLKNGEAFPIAISGSKSRLKGLKAWNTMLMQLAQRQLPLFAKSYIVKAKEKTFDKGVCHVFAFEVGNNNQMLSVEEQQQAYNIMKTFVGKKVIIDQEQETTDDQGPAI